MVYNRFRVVLSCFIVTTCLFGNVVAMDHHESLPSNDVYLQFAEEKLPDPIPSSLRKDVLYMHRDDEGWTSDCTSAKPSDTFMITIIPRHQGGLPRPVTHLFTFTRDKNGEHVVKVLRHNDHQTAIYEDARDMHPNVFLGAFHQAGITLTERTKDGDWALHSFGAIHARFVWVNAPVDGTEAKEATQDATDA